MKLATYILSAGFVLMGAQMSQGALAPDDFNGESKLAAAVLQQDYNTNGLWRTAGWWNSANCIEALENIAAIDAGNEYLPVLANTFKLNRHDHFLNDYYDDEGWWALAWIHAYDLTGRTQYLQTAKEIFRDMAEAWTEHCDGGILWSKPRHYKNAIANELFLEVAIRLHQRTPEDQGTGSYLDWALREWNWFKQTGMINQQGLVNDGLNRECENNGGQTWTYNQGVIVGGLTDLYKSTGNTNYLTAAMGIADATISQLVDAHEVLQEPCEETGCGGGDVPQFKGIFIRNLVYLYDETHAERYRDFLLINARSVWANDRDAENHLGLKWTGPFEATNATCQSSAMTAITALAEPSTKLLPLARGAGSVTFIHDTGTASGTLGWACAANSAPGIMVGGAYSALPKGSHVMHWRMTWDGNGELNTTLARMVLKNATNGTILASREVAGKDFGAANVAQDIQLPFTTTSKNLPVEFELEWVGAAKAAGLTVTDVSMDGANNWTAANLVHEIGRLDGLNGWEADPVRDQDSGYLAKGPELSDLSPGRYQAIFELKVDNFNLDKTKVATISVVETGTGVTVVSRDIARVDFKTVRYQSFALHFRAKAGRRYELRTYWYYTLGAPRLTGRSVVLR